MCLAVSIVTPSDYGPAWSEDLKWYRPRGHCAKAIARHDREKTRIACLEVRQHESGIGRARNFLAVERPLVAHRHTASRLDFKVDG